MGVARVYEAYSPYPDTVVSQLDYAQSPDRMYTVHLDYPVYSATRSSHTGWTFAPVTFGPVVTTPAAPPSAAATSPNMTGYVATTYRYKYTDVGGPNEQESRPSPEVAVTNDLTLSGNFNTITFPALPAGVVRRIVYKEQAGIFGYVGAAEGTTFNDGNPQIQPVLSDTPPVGENPFVGAGNYPSSVTFHDQRLKLGGTRNAPNAVFGSHPADFENFDSSRPNKPTDAISYALVGERVNSINQMVSMDDFLVMSSNGIFAVNGGAEGEALTPSNISSKRQNSRGGSRLNPIVIDENTFYTPAKGSSVRALGFQFEIDGYRSNNVSIFSPHFFKGYEIIDWAYVEEPFSAIFAVRSDGAMLCFTWEAEQQVWGWTLLETEGRFLSVAAITEGGYDRLYALVERTINGEVRRFHERMALPHVDDIALAVHLDCAVTQVYGTASNTVSGLWHLEGATVSVYYDGYVEHDMVVTNGQVTLPNDYETTIATVGLRYSGEIETLPLVLQSRSGSEHTNRQNIAKVVLRTVDTRGITAGITGAAQEDVVEREGGEDGLDDVTQRDYDVTVPGTWANSTTLTIRQDEPLPAHITGVFIEPRVSPK